MTDDKTYNLQIIKKVITSYLDENIPNNQTGLNTLVNQCDDLVYKIASKIYTESGHKVDFIFIRDVIDSRIELLQEYIAKIKEEEARRLEAERLAEERKLQLEKGRRKEKENSRIQDEDKILKYKSNKIEEASYSNDLKYKIKELEIELEKITLNSHLKSIGGIFGTAWTRDYSDIFSSYDHYIDCTLLEIIKYTYISIQSDIDI